MTHDRVRAHSEQALYMAALKDLMEAVHDALGSYAHDKSHDFDLTMGQLRKVWKKVEHAGLVPRAEEEFKAGLDAARKALAEGRAAEYVAGGSA